MPSRWVSLAKQMPPSKHSDVVMSLVPSQDIRYGMDLTSASH